MGRLSVISVMVLVFLGAGGCQKDNEVKKNTTIPGAVDVIVEGGGAFPGSLAGRWKGEKNWEIVFEEDGTISSAKHGIGGVLVKPQHLSTVSDPKQNMKNTYRAGRWMVHYLPNARELRVEIVLEEVHLKWGEIAIDGKVRDMFVGKISEDGKEWRAEWYSFPEYKSPAREDIVLEPNEEQIYAGTILFGKVAESN